MPDHKLLREGMACATRYRLTYDGATVPEQVLAERKEKAALKLSSPKDGPSPSWSVPALDLWHKLAVPLAAREPVTYRREFVDRYLPNESSLLPIALAKELVQHGRMTDLAPVVRTPS